MSEANLGDFLSRTTERTSPKILEDFSKELLVQFLKETVENLLGDFWKNSWRI